MCALGSSFAAGPGLKSADPSAGRSGANYPHLVARALSASLVDATVSGATTANILRDPQRVGWRTFPPQIDSVHEDVELVTVTAGGNDLGYLGSVTRSALAGWFYRHPFTRGIGQNVRNGLAPEPSNADAEKALDGLVEIVRTVRDRAPNATVMLVDYLTLFGPDARPEVSELFTVEEIARFERTAALLGECFVAAAAQSGATLVSASRLSLAHGLGSADPWVRGFSLGLSARALTPFHPNERGMRAVADAVLSKLGEAG